MNRILGSTALAGFIIALLVHVETAAGVDVSSRVPFVWALHVGAILVFGGFVLVAGRKVRLRPLEIGDLLGHLPRWVVLIFILASAYVFWNSLLSLGAGGGSAELIDGQYVLTSHGRVLAHLTEPAYHIHRAYELRFFSGLWLMFYLAPSLYFFFWRDQLPTTGLDT